MLIDLGEITSSSADELTAVLGCCAISTPADRHAKASVSVSLSHSSYQERRAFSEEESSPSRSRRECKSLVKSRNLILLSPGKSKLVKKYRIGDLPVDTVCTESSGNEPVSTDTASIQTSYNSQASQQDEDSTHVTKNRRSDSKNSETISDNSNNESNTISTQSTHSQTDFSLPSGEQTGTILCKPTDENIFDSNVDKLISSLSQSETVVSNTSIVSISSMNSTAISTTSLLGEQSIISEGRQSIQSIQRSFPMPIRVSLSPRSPHKSSQSGNIKTDESFNAPSTCIAPFTNNVRQLNRYSSESDDSFTMSQNETSEASDGEGKLLALQEQLLARKQEAEKLRKEKKRMRREFLASQELALKKQIATYDAFILNARMELEKEMQDLQRSSAVRPVIKKPESRRKSRASELALSLSNFEKSDIADHSIISESSQEKFLKSSYSENLEVSGGYLASNSVKDKTVTDQVNSQKLDLQDLSSQENVTSVEGSSESSCINQADVKPATTFHARTSAGHLQDPLKTIPKAEESSLITIGLPNVLLKQQKEDTSGLLEGDKYDNVDEIVQDTRVILEEIMEDDTASSGSFPFSPRLSIQSSQVSEKPLAENSTLTQESRVSKVTEDNVPQAELPKNILSMPIVEEANSLMSIPSAKTSNYINSDSSSEENDNEYNSSFEDGTSSTAKTSDASACESKANAASQNSDAGSSGASYVTLTKQRSPTKSGSISESIKESDQIMKSDFTHFEKDSGIKTTVNISEDARKDKQFVSESSSSIEEDISEECEENTEGSSGSDDKLHSDSLLPPMLIPDNDVPADCTNGSDSTGEVTLSTDRDKIRRNVYNSSTKLGNIEDTTLLLELARVAALPEELLAVSKPCDDTNNLTDVWTALDNSQHPGYLEKSRLPYISNETSLEQNDNELETVEVSFNKNTSDNIEIKEQITSSANSAIDDNTEDNLRYIDMVTNEILSSLLNETSHLVADILDKKESPVKKPFVSNSEANDEIPSCKTTTESTSTNPVTAKLSLRSESAETNTRSVTVDFSLNDEEMLKLLKPPPVYRARGLLRDDTVKSSSAPTTPAPASGRGEWHIALLSVTVAACITLQLKSGVSVAYLRYTSHDKSII